jgi:Zinc finger, C2H2 type
MLPNIYDFAVDHDNTIYSQRQSARDMPAAYSPETFLSLLTPPESTHDMPLNTNPFIDYTEFESYGSSLHTPYMIEMQALIAAERIALDRLSLSLGDINEDAPDENAETCEDGSVQRLYSPPTPPMAAQPRSLVDKAPSPTPSLSYSVQSGLSTPSPTPIVDDVFVPEEDAKSDSPVPFSPRLEKRSANALRMMPMKRRRVSTTPVSIPNARAARFPCTVPGCNQVCKTLGDLKRHESVLAHKPPSWECPRCHYHFTREDALKRHVKNVSNCANAKARTRDSAMSIKPQHLNEGAKVEPV